MMLVVAIWASARISTGDKLLKLVIEILDEIPQNDAAKLLRL